MAEDGRREIGLISCVKSKRNHATVPRDLYTSEYFSRMRRYAEQEHDEWWILSAKHGLLHPDGEPIEPYEETLREKGVSERREWAEAVAEQLRAEGLFDRPVTFVVHAGKDYYGELLPQLEAIDDVSAEIPTEGLRIGEKLAWYGDRLDV